MLIVALYLYEQQDNAQVNILYYIACLHSLLHIASCTSTLLDSAFFYFMNVKYVAILSGKLC